MTDEEINIAIAEACGWKRPDSPDAMKLKQGWTMPEKWWLCPKGVLRFKHDMPDYCSDLNAMQSAVTSQSPDFQQEFHNRLLSLAGFSHQATSMQWAEIFVDIALRKGILSHEERA